MLKGIDYQHFETRKIMKLTALEIKQQTFDRSIRGYDIAEVQAFLNLVSSEWEHLAARNQELNHEIKKLNEKLKHFERVESALHETLQTAKDQSEQKITGAKKESDHIIEKAEMQAVAIISEASTERQNIRQDTMRLLDRRQEIIIGIRSYLESAQDSVEKFSRDENNLFSFQEKNEKPELKNSGNNKPADDREGGREKRGPVSENLDDILDDID